MTEDVVYKVPKTSEGTVGSGIVVGKNPESNEIDTVYVPLMSTEEFLGSAPVTGKTMVPVPLPVGVDAHTFRKALAAGFNCYLRYGLIDVDKFLSFLPEVNKVIARKILRSPEFRTALMARGVKFGNETGLTPEQDFALIILSDPTKGSFTKKLNTIGVSFATYRAWLKDPIFAEQAQRLGLNSVEEFAHDIMNALTANALEGDLSSIKYVHEMTGRYRPQQHRASKSKSELDAKRLEKIIMSFVEVVQRHVDDPEILQAIATDMSMIASGQSVVQSAKQIEGVTYDDEEEQIDLAF